MNKNGFRQFATVLIGLLTVTLLCAAPAYAKKGETDWSLGPTGARGLIDAWKHTSDARRIVITRVATGSPAAGTLNVGDVIVGVEGRDFDDDARIAFANAITRAEQKEARGVLSLVCLRDGVRRTIELRLPVLGNYSETAPYACDKSQAILERGCEVIAQRGMRSGNAARRRRARERNIGRRPRGEGGGAQKPRRIE